MREPYVDQLIRAYRESRVLVYKHISITVPKYKWVLKLKGKSMEPNNDPTEIPVLSASEAVYGVLAWLTTRKKRTVLSSSDDSSPAAEIAAEFCKTNNLSKPRENWGDNLAYSESFTNERTKK